MLLASKKEKRIEVKGERLRREERKRERRKREKGEGKKNLIGIPVLILLPLFSISCYETVAYRGNEEEEEEEEENVLKNVDCDLWDILKTVAGHYER
jgi:hypothetical protein